MEEKYTGGTVSFKERLENFWYHYKWHTIVALFLILTVTISTLQMCSKVSFDTYIMYAGAHEIDRTNEDGDVSDYKATLSSLGRVAADYNKDGEVTVSFKDLFTPSEEELAEIKAENPKAQINYALIDEDERILLENMRYSDYYVCLISKSVYERYKTVDEFEIFAPLSQYVKAGATPEYYSENAILLSSVGFYSLPGISDLPSDTLICLRRISPFAQKTNGKRANSEFKKAEEIITKILNYQ
jgi:hypothetical protein